MFLEVFHYFGSIGSLIKKGDSLHKSIGQLYFLVGLIGTAVSSVIASYPKNYSLFLGSLGILTLYLIGGFYAFKMSRNRLIAVTFMMSITLVIMIFYGFLLCISQGNRNGSILLLFGLLTASNVFIVDYKIYIRQKAKFKSKNKTPLHISKMIASYIWMTTAFVVVNNMLYFNFLNWILLGFTGGFLIKHYIRKGGETSKK